MCYIDRRLAIMKYLDKVKLIVDKEKYKKDKIKKGEIGTIWLPEIRDNSFYVAFETGEISNWYKYANIDIEDLELVDNGIATDEGIIDALPKNNPQWWCKVENGYIKNLLGENKNKIPYDYNS